MSPSAPYVIWITSKSKGLLEVHGSENGNLPDEAKRVGSVPLRGRARDSNLGVDDLLFWSKDEKHIHELAVTLREAGVDLKQEDDAARFLGVRLEKNEAGQIEMKQTGLID